MHLQQASNPLHNLPQNYIDKRVRLASFSDPVQVSFKSLVHLLPLAHLLKVAARFGPAALLWELTVSTRMQTKISTVRIDFKKPLKWVHFKQRLVISQVLQVWLKKVVCNIWGAQYPILLQSNFITNCLISYSILQGQNAVHVWTRKLLTCVCVFV